MMAGRLSLQWRQTMTFLIRALVMRDYIPNFWVFTETITSKEAGSNWETKYQCSLQLPWT